MCCAVVLDVHSRRVVGWSIDSSQTAALATNALGRQAAISGSPLCWWRPSGPSPESKIAMRGVH
jgi:transposase InsO family protein